MMKGMFKRALGVVAAAAMAVTGMAALTGTANAAEISDPVNFTFNAGSAEQLTNRNVDAYLIGKFVSYGQEPNIEYTVETADGVDVSALRTALVAAGFADVPAANSGKDLLAWAASQTTGRQFDQSDSIATGNVSRLFADSLAENLTGMTATRKNIFKGLLASDEDGDGTYSITVSLPAGLYLFVDDSPSVGTVTPSAPMIVGTGRIEDKKLTSVMEPAVINFKNERNTSWSKDSEFVKGHRIQYTLQGKMPDYADSFAFYDKPGVGLSIDPTTFHVYAAEKELNYDAEYTIDWVSMPQDDSGLHPATENGKFTITIANPVPGTTYKAVYEAVVNEDGLDEDGFANHLTDENGTDVTTPTSDKVYSFSFKKVDAQSKALQDATFTIYQEDGTTFGDDYVGGSNGNTTSTSDANGTVMFKALPAGTYLVRETSPAPGFKDLSLSFKVVITENGDGGATVEFTDEDSTVKAVSTLVTKGDDGVWQVMNVQSVAQLPMTGAAGITMFVVLGLLIAGAGVTVYMKSRGVRNAMRA